MHTSKAQNLSPISSPQADALTLLSCVQTSLRLLSSRTTPQNAALAEQYQQIRAALNQNMPLQPGQITLLQRSVLSTSALVDGGGDPDGPPSSVTLAALAHARLALHARVTGAGDEDDQASYANFGHASSQLYPDASSSPPHR